MTWVSDEAIARLREITEQPELDGTRYSLLREAGRGGMGIVYEAEDGELGRAVALKMGSVSGEDTDRLRREARIIARLEHPGIVPLHDLGVLPDGRVYYTMKLVRGVRLDVWAANRTRTEKLRLFARVCEPVAFAHANGVVHRDLKPENVMVGSFGEALVMDWGVAQPLDEPDAGIAGTPGYMAPEQARGESAGPAADIHALGKVLEFLVRGEEVPRPLAAIIARATATDPAARYADARALSEDVLRFLDGEPVSAYRENVFERSSRWLTRNRALLAMILAYLVMRAIAILWMRF